MTARQRLLGRKSAGSIIDLRTEATQLLLSLAKVLNTTTDGMSPEELGPRDLLLNFFVVHGHAFSASQKVGIGLCFWSRPDLHSVTIGWRICSQITRLRHIRLASDESRQNEILM